MRRSTSPNAAAPDVDPEWIHRHELPSRSVSRGPSISRTQRKSSVPGAGPDSQPYTGPGGIVGNGGRSSALPPGLEEEGGAASSGLSTSTTNSSSGSDSSTIGSLSASSSPSSAKGMGARTAVGDPAAAESASDQKPQHIEADAQLTAALASSPPRAPHAAAEMAVSGGEKDGTSHAGMAAASAELAAAAAMASEPDIARDGASAGVAALPVTSTGRLQAASPVSHVSEVPISEPNALVHVVTQAAAAAAEHAAVGTTLQQPSSSAPELQSPTEALGPEQAAEQGPDRKAAPNARTAVARTLSIADAAVQQSADELGPAAGSAAPEEGPVTASITEATQLRSADGRASLVGQARCKRHPIVWSGVPAAPAPSAPAAAQPAPPAGEADNDGGASVGQSAERLGRTVGDGADAALLLRPAGLAGTERAMAPTKRARSVSIGPAAPDPLMSVLAAASRAPAPPIDGQQKEKRVPAYLRLGPLALAAQPATGNVANTPVLGDVDQACCLPLRWPERLKLVQPPLTKVVSFPGSRLYVPCWRLLDGVFICGVFQPSSLLQKCSAGQDEPRVSETQPDRCLFTCRSCQRSEGEAQMT